MARSEPIRPRVLDTSALLSGRSFEGELFATEEVVRELGRLKAITPELASFLDLKVRIVAPSSESLAALRAASERTGDAHRLSPTDMGVLAAASQLNATVVTDDYSIQNLAAVVGVPYEHVMEGGITEVVRWRYRCTGCGKFYETWVEPCPICGARLRTTRARP